MSLLPAWVVVLVALLSRALSALNSHAAKPAAHVLFDFEVFHGDSRQALSPSDQDPLRFVKRDSASVKLVNQQTFYLVQLQIGSNKDQVGVLLDTGSSDLWISSSRVACSKAVGSNSALRDLALPHGEPINLPLDRPLGKRDVVLAGKWTPSQADPAQPEAESAIRAGHLRRDVQLGQAWAKDDSVPLVSGMHQKAFATRSALGASCTQYGSFNTEGSQSFKRNSLAPAFNILYADNLGANGIWGTDTVYLGDTSVPGLLMAVANSTSSNVGVLGVGLMALETTYHSSGSSSYTYENLPFRMRSQKIINKALYSLYLGKATSQSGVILFGAIDAAKFSGQLMTVPVVLATPLNNAKPMRLEIAVNGMFLDGASGNVTVLSNTYAALLDLGTTFSYLSQLLLTKLGDTLGARYLSSLSAYIMSCNVDPKAFLVLNFSGKEIRVPLLDLVAQYSNLGCFLLILPLTSAYLVLGDNILRSMYVVYDLEDYEISIAQASYSTNEEIKEVTSSVPDATRAPGYLSGAVIGLASEGPASSLFTTAAYTCGPLKLGRCKKSLATSIITQLSLSYWVYLALGAIAALVLF